MFIVVKYGDNKQQLFNPRCLGSALLTNIRERCGCSAEDVLDLADEEGNVKRLHKRLSEDPASLCRDRESLILVKEIRVTNTEGVEENLYMPLLDQLEDDDNFIKRLNSSGHKRGKRLSAAAGSGVGVGGALAGGLRPSDKTNGSGAGSQSSRRVSVSANRASIDKGSSGGGGGGGGGGVSSRRSSKIK